jgi:hypothetical protein
MTEGREIRFYDYMNHPYEQVRDALRQNALAGHRIAEVSVHRFVSDVAAHLRQSLA